MITVSTDFVGDQESNAPSPTILKLFLYKQWPGAITDYAAGSIKIAGDASDFFSVDDNVLLSTKDLNTEFTLATVTFVDADNKTTLTFDEAGDYSVKNTPGNDFVFLKFDATDYILKQSVGDIRKNYEVDSFGKLRPFQFNFSLLDDGDQFDLTGSSSSPQFLYKDSLLLSVSSVSLVGTDTEITFNEDLSGYTNALLKQYYVDIIDGNKRENKAKIKTPTVSSDKLEIDEDWSGDIEADDTVVIAIQNKFLVKFQMNIKGHASDEVNTFFGVIYPKNVTKANRRVDIISYSLLIDFNETYALKISDLTTEEIDIPGIPGVSIYEYEDGNIPKEKVVKVKYKHPSGKLQKIGGLKINSASVDTGSIIRILRFKHPDYFQWDGGSWVQKSSTATSQTLTAADGSTINCDFRPSDYPKRQDAEEFVFFDPVSKQQVSLARRGPAGIQFDSGEIAQLYTKFFKIWVDETYAAGTLTGLTDVSNDSPIEVVPDVTTAIAIYFVLPSKFGAIEFKGLRQPGDSLTARMSWEYSVPFGVDPACFESLTVTDGTSGMSQDGIVNITIPDDWGRLAKVGAAIETSSFIVRLKITAGTAYKKEFNQVIPYVVAEGQDGDKFTVKSENYRLGKEKDTYESSVIVRYDDTDGDTLNIANWKQCIPASDILSDILDKSGYGVTTDEPTYPGLITLPKETLNVWGKPYSSEERMPTAIHGLDGNETLAGSIFCAYKNQIFMLSSVTGSWSKIAEVDYYYTIKSIHYFELTEDAATRYFILAHGFKDVVPDDSILNTDHYEQPDQVLVRVDDLNTTPVARYTYTDNGGNLAVTTQSAGNGLIDNYNLFRSGAGLTTAAPTVTNFNAIGDVNATATVAYQFKSNSIIIPFPQMTLNLISYINLLSDDIFVGIDSLMDNIVYPGTDSPDYPEPFTMMPGYYGYLSSQTAVALFADIAFKHTLGQRGGLVGVHFSGLSSSPYGLYGQRYPDSPAAWSDNIRRYLYQYLPRTTLPMTESGRDMGCGQWPQSAFSENTNVDDATFMAREFLLDAVQMPEDAVTPYRDFLIQSILTDWYQMDDSDYEANEARIEITTERIGTDAAFIPSNMTCVHYDSSAATYNTINMSWASSVQLDQNDWLYFSLPSKYGRMYLQTTVTGTVTLEAKQFVMQTGANGSWQTVGLHEDDFSGATPGARNGLVDFPLQRHWHYQTAALSGVTGIGTGYQFGIKQTGTGNLVVSWAGITRRQIWTSDIDWPTNSKHYIPIEIEYNRYDKCIYGCMFDQADLQYSIFCLEDSDDFDTSTGISNISFQQLTDAELVPTGFAHNRDDGWVYFATADKKYMKKTAKLYRCKCTDPSADTWTVEDLGDLVAGEWDIPTRLTVVNNGVYGFTGPNRGYFWEYKDEIKIRFPIANFGDKKLLGALNDVSQILNYIVYTDEEAQTVVKDRFTGTPSIDKQFDEKHIKSIGFVRNQEQVMAVDVEWDDGEFSGIEKVGIIRDGILPNTINNNLIMFPQIARLVGLNVWKYGITYKRSVETVCKLLQQYQLFDQANLLTSNMKKFSSFGLTSSDNWFIKSLTLSYKRRNTSITFLENKEV